MLSFDDTDASPSYDGLGNSSPTAHPLATHPLLADTRRDKARAREILADGAGMLASLEGSLASHEERSPSSFESLLVRVARAASRVARLRRCAPRLTLSHNLLTSPSLNGLHCINCAIHTSGSSTPFPCPAIADIPCCCCATSCPAEMGPPSAGGSCVVMAMMDRSKGDVDAGVET